MLKISGLLTNMRETREKLRLSQERVAEALGISAATLSEMESGHIAVGLERWLKWCAILKKSPTDVLRAWERGSEFEQISKERRDGYCKVVNEMIKYGYGLEIETIIMVFREILDRDKHKRAIEKSKRSVKRYFPRVNT